MKKIFLLSMFLLGLMTSFSQKTDSRLRPIVKKAIWFRVSPSLETLIENSKKNPRPAPAENREFENELEFRPYDTGVEESDVLSDIQQGYTYNRTPATLNEIADFAGVGNLDGVAPPDTCGDVSNDYYMQCVNGHTIIKNKNGGTVKAAFPTSDFWQGSGYDDRNNGDAVILWDEQAQRWLVTQFYTDPNNECLLIAVSKTSDPMGSYYQYAFSYQYMPDYPKWAVWPDAYYVGANAFDQNNNYNYKGTYVTAFERAKILTGDPNARSVTFGPNANLWSVFPADADVFPAVGTPCPFLSDEVASTSGNNNVYLYNFHVDWNNTANSSFNLSKTFTVANYSLFSSDGAQVPQPGTSQRLDLLHSRIMFRPYYRHFTDHESLLMTRTVKDGSVAAIRWYEFRKTGSGSWTVHQQGTYNPGDGLWRWMPSIAMNAQGDIALGYSVSNGSNKYPSIRCVARYNDDTLGVMTTNESEFFTGSASQSGVSRWGDYSMMSVDPSDNESFWFTTEYSTGNWNWETRIIHFDLPEQSGGGGGCTVCTSNGNTQYQTSTTLVKLNTLNNSSAKPGAYSDYTSMSTDLAKESVYPLTVKVNTDGNYTTYTKVWIDWNQDCDFDDAGETYDLGSARNVSNGSTSNSPLNITVPASAVNGATRMRVSTRYYSTPGACDTGYDGEVEDYTVNIVDSSGGGGNNCTPCASTYSDLDDDYISRVQFNTIDNSSGGTNIPDSYQDFTDISTNVSPGQSYSMTVKIIMNGNWHQYVKAFIDWNGDCDFNDSGETYTIGDLTGTGSVTSSITVPYNVSSGSKIMRIVEQYSSQPTACDTHNTRYGATEDYTVVVVGGNGFESTHVQPSSLSEPVIFPNPTDGEVHITWSQEGAMNIRVTDLTGKVIYEALDLMNDDKTHQFGIPGLRSGIYFVHMQINDEEYIQKLILK